MTRRSKFGWADFLLGAVLICLGIYIFISPQAAVNSILVISSALAIISGILDIVFYIRLENDRAAVSLVTGIISALAGFMLLLNPVMGRWIIGAVFAIWFVAHSISRVACYKTVRALAGRGAAAISLVLNAPGLVLGVLMVVSPVVSALSLGYLVATALVVHGAGSVTEAFSKMGARQPPNTAEQEELGWQ